MLVAAVQLTSKSNKKKNLAVAKALMTRALRQGAELITLPEYFSFIGPRTEMIKEAEPPEGGAAFELAHDFAHKNKVFVLAGSIPIVLPEASDRRLVNRSILFDTKGKVLATYDKIHLFDTALEAVKSYRESETFQAGSSLVVAETAFGKVGLTVCYDLRFPEVFRTLTLQHGARMIFVPSAFTMYTGKDHWLPLLKARAIENQVYIIAPAQIGRHSESKVSYGKSCVIDPWGNVTAVAPDCETVIVADVDFKFLSKVRKELPVLKHFRKDIRYLG